MGNSERNSIMKTILTFLALLTVRVALAGPDPASRTADHDYDPPAPGSYALPIIKAAADGALLNVNNQPLQLRELTRGRITVMSFIYTRCAAARACPYATGVLLELHRVSAE